MKRLSRILTAATFALALPLGLSAQAPTPTPTPTPTPAPAPAPSATEKLEAGTWTGTVTPPDGPALALSFVVATAGDTTKVDMTIAEMGMSFPLSAIKLEGKKLNFEFLAGDELISCALEKKDDASYGGTCADASGMGGPITMVPPKKGTPTP